MDADRALLVYTLKEGLETNSQQGQLSLASLVEDFRPFTELDTIQHLRGLMEHWMAVIVLVEENPESGRFGYSTSWSEQEQKMFLRLVDVTRKRLEQLIDSVDATEKSRSLTTSMLGEVYEEKRKASLELYRDVGSFVRRDPNYV